MHMWHRGLPEATTVGAIPAGSICIFCATNSAEVEVLGTPAAPRITWHKSADTLGNLIGISIDPSKTVRIANYMDGFTANPDALYYRISGGISSIQPNQLRINNASQNLSNGNVLLVPANAASDWSGVLYVSPMNGVDLGTDNSYTRVSVRNDSTRTREISFDVAAPTGCASIDRAIINYRDQTDAYTNGAWRAWIIGSPITKNVKSGETWTIQLGVDRSRMPRNQTRGTPFGALLRFEDKGGSQMRATIPFKIESSGNEDNTARLNAGLWIAEVAFNEVSNTPKDGEATDYAEAGGVFRARLPFHIDDDGNVKLLQRVVFAGETDNEGNFNYGLFDGSARIPDRATKGLRISSVSLPTELPVIPAKDKNLENGEFTFEFVVDGGGATSIARHPYHPQHDGLRWDFKTAAPSGDDVKNYVGTVKPEVFSVSNSISLKIDGWTGIGWEPNNTLTGTCEWMLHGLRHEGPVKMRGAVGVRRISTETRLNDFNY